jgi:glycosyltransferase involved in cell wall biosynthesis
MEISLVIPVKNDHNSFIELFQSITKQLLSPKEVIIIDSSDSNKIKTYINNNINNIDIDVNYIKVFNKYPGEGRNEGIKNSKYEHIAFLDSKTIPKNNWLYDQAKNLKDNDYDCVFGKTRYIALNKFQKSINAATFGNIDHVTTPGTLIKKEILLENNFIEGVRTADDLEWRERLVNKKYKIGVPKENQLIYKSLPSNILHLLKRYFIYSFHTAQVNVDNKLKLIYFFLISIFLFLIIPRWNHYIPAWNINHPLYILNHTKFYLLMFLSMFLIIVSMKNLPNISKGILNFYTKLVIIILSIYFVYNWNFFVLNLIEKSSFYIPHITKIFITTVFLSSFLIRGIYYPLKRKLNIKYIFPFNWLKIGFYGFLIDIVKAPAYLYGAVLPSLFLKKNILHSFDANLVFYTKYANKSPSYRTRFHSYKHFFKKFMINVQTKELFDENFYNNRIFKSKINFYKLLYCYFYRTKDLLFRKKPFVAIVHVELLPYIPFIAEFILKIRRIPYIIDIDDAVYFRFKNKKKFLYFIDKIKFKYMMSNSFSILAGNNFHVNYLRQYNNNVHYFPTTIDFKKYNYLLHNKKHKIFTIVWIGTPSTTFYLSNIVKILNKIKSNYNINIKVIGADKKIIPNLKCEYIDWTEENEVEEISKCHLGIMPLNNSDWELGKCAYKILQYMALKLPVVASPVGVNKEIIIDNNNGMLANNDNEWYDKISQLLNDNNLINKISNNGYNTVFKQFNIENYKMPYLKVLKSLLRINTQ